MAQRIQQCLSQLKATGYPNWQAPRPAAPLDSVSAERARTVRPPHSPRPLLLLSSLLCSLVGCSAFASHVPRNHNLCWSPRRWQSGRWKRMRSPPRRCGRLPDSVSSNRSMCSPETHFTFTTYIRIFIYKLIYEYPHCIGIVVIVRPLTINGSHDLLSGVRVFFFYLYRSI